MIHLTTIPPHSLVVLNSSSHKSTPTYLSYNRCRSQLGEFRKRGLSLFRATNSEGDQEANHNSLSEEDPKVESEASHENNLQENLDVNVQEPSTVTSGFPLPGLKTPRQPVTISKTVLDILRDQVFGFDTFFVTGQETNEGSVLFKGNLRGDASKTFVKLSKKLQDRFGDEYKLFLLISPDDDRPVAIIAPKESVQPDPAPVPEWIVVSSFGLVTFLTILLRNSPLLQLNFQSPMEITKLLLNSLPGGLVTMLILAAHEAGHYYGAKKVGAQLGPPYFIPSFQLGSFGGITRIMSIVKKREDLLEIAAAGPLAGAALSFLILLIGLSLPPGEGQGILVNATAFHDSLLVGTLAKIIFGDVLKEGASLSVNPLVLLGWSGLLINAINSIPYGELDGGRISQALWGRKVWSRINGVSIALLGFSALFSDVALYWVVLVIFLQRGPIVPQAEEISPPDNIHVAVGIIVLLLAALVCLPYPFPLT